MLEYCLLSIVQRDMACKSVHGREAISLKNGIPTLCKGLQFNSSASPCRPPKQTNKQVCKFGIVLNKTQATDQPYLVQS